MYPTQNVIDGPHCAFNELWMMDRKESPSIVIITEKGNDERHFPPAFFPFFFSNFDNSRAIVRPSGGGGGGKWRGARRHGDATAQRWYGGEMARVGARWYGTYLSLSRGDCGGGLLWTLRFWGISASLHNWTIVSCTFLWDPQSVKIMDYGCPIKSFLKMFWPIAHKVRNIHIESYEQFKWNLYLYVSGQTWNLDRLTHL